MTCAPGAIAEREDHDNRRRRDGHGGVEVRPRAIAEREDHHFCLRYGFSVLLETNFSHRDWHFWPFFLWHLHFWPVTTEQICLRQVPLSSDVAS